VNLTSLLVLTTLFISVSGSLPQTAYVKMVDIWLIFAQVIPWIEVLLHTWIDVMRTDTEEGREINHHGRTVIVGGSQVSHSDTVTVSRHQGVYPHTQSTLGETNGRNSRASYRDMTQVDEEKLVQARKEFYSDIEGDRKAVGRLQFVTRTVVPTSILLFSGLYWGYGLFQYYKED